MAPQSPFKYIECDIPEGVSVREWRDARNHAPRRLRRLRRSLLKARRRLGLL